MGDLDRVLVDRHQAALDENGEGGGRVLVALGLQLGERDPPADRHRLLGVGEPQEDRPGALALGRAEPTVGALREPGHRPVDAAASLVRGAAQGAAAALLPELDQGGGEQRQPSGLVGDVADQRRDERRLDAQPRPAGGKLDRPAQLLAAHRPDEHVVRTHLGGELRVFGAAAVEVGSDPEHHQGALVGVRRDRDDRLHEGGPLALVAAGGEDLLELIDGQYQPLVWPERGQGPGERVVVIPLTLAGGDAGQRAAELRERVLARSHQHLRPALGAGKRLRPASDGRSPARISEDLPLPDGPTTAIRVEPTRRATRSATSRSRPKKYSAWAASNGARPRNGQTSGSEGSDGSATR